MGLTNITLGEAGRSYTTGVACQLTTQEVPAQLVCPLQGSIAPDDL